MEFHINKHESYFILEGELDIGLRFGRAKQRITKLKEEQYIYYASWNNAYENG